MSYLQPATNNYFGFMPVGPARIGVYAVSSSEGGAISIGDVVTLTSIATARVVTGGFATTMLGVAASPLAANAGSTAARPNSDSSQLIKVWDDPYQVFVTCDTTSGLVGSTSVFKGVNVLATGAVGATGPIGIQSVMAISGVTASSGDHPFKLIGLHPIEAGYSTDANGTGVAASVRKLLVQPLLHFHGQGIGGFIITS